MRDDLELAAAVGIIIVCMAGWTVIDTFGGPHEVGRGLYRHAVTTTAAALAG